MSMSRNPVFSLKSREGNHLTLQSPEGHVAHVFILEEDIIRVMLLPDGVLRAPRTWAIAPGEEDVDFTGRDRFDLAGFALPEYEVKQTAGSLCISTKDVRLTLELSGFFCRWETRKIGTVSYTHLDVYKRQAPSSLHRQRGPVVPAAHSSVSGDWESLRPHPPY